MAIFGGRKARKTRARANAEWGNFNRNLVAWNENSPRKSGAAIETKTRNAAQKTRDLGAKKNNFIAENPRKNLRATTRNPNLTEKTRLENLGEMPFRRNQTLTTRPHEIREESARAREKKLRVRRRRIGATLVFVAIFCAFGLAILSQFSGGNLSVTSKNTKLSAGDAANYAKIAEKYLRENPFERFSFGRSAENFSLAIERAAPEIASATLSPSGFGGGSLELSFREPVASWTVGAETSFVDKVGVVFARNFFAAPKIAISDESGVRDVSASAAFLSFVGQVSAALAQNSYAVERIVVPRGAIRYTDFFIAGRKYPFMAQIDRAPAAQIADIMASIRYLDQNKIAPQYVDVRVAGKMYWK